MHKTSEGVHSCQSVCSRGSSSSICFSTSVCSCFYSCRLPLMTGRAPPTRPWCQPVSRRQLLGQELPAFSHLLPPGRVAGQRLRWRGRQIALVWNWEWRVWGVTQRMQVWGHPRPHARTYFFLFSFLPQLPQTATSTFTLNKKKKKGAKV